MFVHDVWFSYDSPFPVIKSCLLFQCRVVRIPDRPVKRGMGYVTPPQTSLPSSGVFSHSEAVRSFSTVALRIMSVFSGPNKNFLHMVPITQPTKEPLRSVPPNNNKQSPVCKHHLCRCNIMQYCQGAFRFLLWMSVSLLSFTNVFVFYRDGRRERVREKQGKTKARHQRKKKPNTILKALIDGISILS